MEVEKIEKKIPEFLKDFEKKNKKISLKKILGICENRKKIPSFLKYYEKIPRFQKRILKKEIRKIPQKKSLDFVKMEKNPSFLKCYEKNPCIFKKDFE